MPDQRRHRGPHPEDSEIFSAKKVPLLREAARDLAWLLNRGYAPTSSLKIVGDRYSLLARQRIAVGRCVCTDEAAERRRRHKMAADELAGGELWIDGYNVLTSVEAALAGGVILHARDGCFRDMASMHGNYRKVEETLPALHLLGELLADWKIERCHWLLDQPVSNSGRLKTLIQQVAAEQGWRWETTLAPDPDPILMETEHPAASSDSQILDHAERWFNLARTTISLRTPAAWVIDLSD